MAINFTTNHNLINEPAYPCKADSLIFTGTFFILIFNISLIGNSLVLCVLFIYEGMKSITNIFILNLACSDLIFTITLPFWAVDHLHHWIFGDFGCKCITAGFFVGLYNSVILLTAMTVARFIRVVLPTWKSNRARRKKCAVGACVAAWVISISASLSDAVKVEVVHENGTNYCNNESDDNLGCYLQVSLLFFFPFAIIIFCYSAILKTVLQGLNRKKHKTVGVLLCIVAAFFVCWGPYHIMLLFKALNTPTDCKAKELVDVAYRICEMLAYSHCCMNPLLYMFSQKLRKHLLNLLRSKNVCRKNRERDTGHNVAFTDQRSDVSPEKESLN